MDWSDDSEFYNKPRLVNHLDAKVIEIITRFYAGILKPGMKVLDLMSTWKLHIPENLELGEVIGLRMNQQELEKNNQLTDYLVFDLNKTPRMPFEDNTFDIFICTFSIEYLTQLFEVFEDVSRILKAGGYFIVTFSNCWFAPKVINI
jgi:ubiquinone/menaquinone biosynthesis C-methylase UbiE